MIRINWKKAVKRTACLICAVGILTSDGMIPNVAWAEESARYEIVEVTEGTPKVDVLVNIRKGPGTKYAVITGMKPGETCMLLGEEENWYKVQYGEVEGYVSKDLLSVRTYETQQPLPTPTPTAMPGYELVEITVGEVIGEDVVNMRAGAGKKFDLLMQMAPGDVCTVLDEETDKEETWCKVQFGELEGYVLKDYLEITVQLIQVPLATETPTPTPTDEAEAGYEWAEVSVGTLIAQIQSNVRAGAGTNYEIIEHMNPGETCVVKEEQDGWCRIEFNGKEGWISRDLIEISVEQTQIPLPTETPSPTGRPDAEAGYEWAEVSVGTLIAQIQSNVRAGAGTNYEIIEHMNPGETCFVKEEQDGWCRIEFNGKEGWISRDLIEISVEQTQIPLPTETPSPTDRPDAEAGYEWAEVSVGTLIAQVRTNVRKGAGTKYDSIDQMSPGETCIVLGEEGDWYRIEFDGQTGYIAKEFVSVERQTMQRPIATETPEPAETSEPDHELRSALVGTVIAEASTSFRTGPGANYDTIDYIAPGKTCIVLDDEMEWYEVMYDGRVGYVAKEYLTVEEKVTQVPLTTATPEPTVEPTAVSATENGDAMLATVIGETNVNALAGAGDDYDAVFQLAPGETCIVLGEEGDWYRVEANGLGGYLPKTALETGAQTTQLPQDLPAEQMTAAPGYELVEVIEGTLITKQETNVRKGPGTDYSVVTRMQPGEICRVWGEEGEWYRIEYAGQKGYIMKEFIQTRSYTTQVPIIEEDPLDAYVVGFDVPRMMARKQSVSMEGAVEANIPMTGITVSIYDERSMVEETSATVEFAHDEGVRTFDLQNMDGELRFSRLGAGEKCICITVTSNSEEQVVFETDFYVTGECEEPVSVTEACSFTSRANRADRAVDGRWDTAWEPTAAGDEMQISIPADVTSETLTLEWSSAPGAFEIVLDGETVREENAAGMISFCIPTGGASEIVIRVSDASAGICEARVYAADRTPEVIHDWQPAGEHVDMMVIVAHPGDEFLYLGGAIPQALAEGKEVLVVYMADCGRKRSAEAMDGLWAVGVRTHPVFMNLENGRADDYEDAIEMWGLEETYEIMVELLRKYKPDVVVTHGIEGEDGDNQHKLTSAALRRAVLLATDEETYPESSAQYGVWDVRKTYIHQYEGNVLTLDAEAAQTALDGWMLSEKIAVGLSKNRTLAEDYDMDDVEKYAPYSFGVVRVADGVADDVLKNGFFENIGESVE